MDMEKKRKGNYELKNREGNHSKKENADREKLISER
jgi:hypothetical protein